MLPRVVKAAKLLESGIRLVGLQPTRQSIGPNRYPRSIGIQFRR
jgi:hypothetical protein